MKSIKVFEKMKYIYILLPKTLRKSPKKSSLKLGKFFSKIHCILRHIFFIKIQYDLYKYRLSSLCSRRQSSIWTLQKSILISDFMWYHDYFITIIILTSFYRSHVPSYTIKCRVMRKRQIITDIPCLNRIIYSWVLIKYLFD